MELEPFNVIPKELTIEIIEKVCEDGTDYITMPAGENRTYFACRLVCKRWDELMCNDVTIFTKVKVRAYYACRIALVTVFKKIHYIQPVFYKSESDQYKKDFKFGQKLILLNKYTKKIKNHSKLKSCDDVQRRINKKTIEIVESKRMIINQIFFDALENGDQTMLEFVYPDDRIDLNRAFVSAVQNCNIGAVDFILRSSDFDRTLVH